MTQEAPQASRLETLFRSYSAGEISREELVETVSAFDFEPSTRPVGWNHPGGYTPDSWEDVLVAYWSRRINSSIYDELVEKVADKRIQEPKRDTDLDEKMIEDVA